MAAKAGQTVRDHTVWRRLERAMPPAVRAVIRRLAPRGRVVLVGGAVRDACLGQPIGDWDLATDLRPAEVAAAFARVSRAGEQHGTIMVLEAGAAVEVTTFRGEGPYLDGRRPASVFFHRELEADLGRRDFTINAMAVEPASGRLIDPFGGRTDLAARLVRSVGRAEDRFAEDGLRLLRALRFAAVLGFRLAATTRVALPGAASTLARVAWERRRVELEKLLAASYPLGPILRTMEQSGLLVHVATELGARGVSWPAIDRLPRRPYLRLAAWCAARRLDDEAVDTLLVRLRAAKRDQEQTRRVVRAAAALRRLPAAVERRAWITTTGREIALDAARVVAATRGPGFARLPAQVSTELRAGGPLSVRELAVDGADLIAMGVEGPAVGELLRRLLASVQRRQLPNRRRALVALAHSLSTAGTPNSD